MGDGYVCFHCSCLRIRILHGPRACLDTLHSCLAGVWKYNRRLCPFLSGRRRLSCDRVTHRKALSKLIELSRLVAVTDCHSSLLWQSMVLQGIEAGREHGEASDLWACGIEFRGVLWRVSSCSMRGCYSIVSMLSVPPPFMRPRDAQKSADKAHRAFASGCGDQLALLASLRLPTPISEQQCCMKTVPHPASDGDRVFFLGIVVLFPARLCLSTARWIFLFHNRDRYP